MTKELGYHNNLETLYPILDTLILILDTPIPDTLIPGTLIPDILIRT